MCPAVSCPTHICILCPRDSFAAVAARRSWALQKALSRPRLNPQGACCLDKCAGVGYRVVLWRVGQCIMDTCPEKHNKQIVLRPRSLHLQSQAVGFEEVRHCSRRLS